MIKKTNTHIVCYLFFFISFLTITTETECQESFGEKLYDNHCSDCHSLNLRGSAHGSSLIGKDFISKWDKDQFKGLFEYTKENMPPGKVGSLDNAELLEIHNYILTSNDVSNNDGFVSFSDPSTIDQPENRVSNFKNKSLNNFKNITLQNINYPPDSDWLSWRRTTDGKGYSPLKIINTKNIKNIKLSWSLTMNEGSNQITPIVSQGIMFLTNPGNIIQALDAKNGELIWEYRYPFPKASKTLGGPTRNIAVYEDKIFLATYDAHLIALNIRTGKLIWKTKKANYEDGYTHTSGPIIANGVVISGINGCERYIKEGCFITGHDPDTGKEIWRTSSIAQPDDKYGYTWGETPSVFRAGGDTWIPGSYDPKLNLFFIGTSQAKPWVAASRGMTPKNSALYTNSTLALNPSTGEIVWYFQHVPGETIDMEVGFERVLVDIDQRKYVITIGKDGILWKLDSRTGEFIDLVETLPQNLFPEINREDGRVKYRSDILEAKIGDTISVCPGIYGGHNWQSSALDPSRNTLIIPLHQTCSDMTGRAVELELGGGGYGGDSATYPMPGTDGNLGRLVAYDLKTMKENWSIQQRAMFLTGALTTGGGLVFIGDLDRYFRAFDIMNGEELWSIRLPAALHGYPVSFGFDGKQYVAVQTGIGVFRALTATLSPDIYQPSSGQAIHVFSLD